MGKYDDLFDVAPTPTPTPAPGKYADLFDDEPRPTPLPSPTGTPIAVINPEAGGLRQIPDWFRPRSGMQFEHEEARQFMEHPEEPLFPIPRIPQQESLPEREGLEVPFGWPTSGMQQESLAARIAAQDLPQTAAGAVNVGAGLVEGLETPMAAGILPVAAAPPIEALIAAQMGHGAYEAGKEAFAPDLTMQQRTEAAGSGLAQLILAGLLAKGAIGKVKPMFAGEKPQVLPTPSGGIEPPPGEGPFGFPTGEPTTPIAPPLPPTAPAPTLADKIKQPPPAPIVTPVVPAGTGQVHLIEQIKPLVNPETGAFTRGGDYIRSVMEQAPDEQLIDFIRWSKTPETTPYVARFGADYAADVLRQRNVPVDEISWQIQNIKEPAPAPPITPAAPTAPVTPEVAPPPAKPGRKFTVRPPFDAFGSEITPIAAHLIDTLGGVVSKSAARAKGRFEGNNALWDGAPKLGHTTHNKIYNPGGMMPDEAAQSLYDAGLIADPYADTMWQALQKESHQVRTTAVGQRAVEAEAKKVIGQGRAFEQTQQRGAKAGTPGVPARDLQVGDSLEIGGEQFKVIDIDPDTFDVVLEDGSKFGVQSVADDAVIYGEYEAGPVTKGQETPAAAQEPPPASEGGAFTEADAAALAKLERAEGSLTESGRKKLKTLRARRDQRPPVLRPGEQGTGELLQGEDQPFNLAGEVDPNLKTAAEEAAAQTAAKSKAEAEALAEKQQGNLFDEQAKTEIDEMNKPKLGLRKRGGIRGAILAPARRAANIIRSGERPIRDMFRYMRGTVVPRLSEAGVLPEAIQYAGVRGYIPRIVNERLAKVFPDIFDDMGKMREVTATIRDDNILGGYDSAVAELEKLKASGAEPDLIARQEEAIANIENAHDLPALDARVQAARGSWQEPYIENWGREVSPLMDQLYNEYKGFDPATPQETRGRHYSARMNLLPDFAEEAMADISDPTKASIPQSEVTNYRNPDVRRDKFMRKALLTGKYSDNPEMILTNSFAGRWRNVAQMRFYNALVDKGVAKWIEPGDIRDPAIGGIKAKDFYVKIPITDPRTGLTHMGHRTLRVQGHLVPEMRQLIDTEMRWKDNPILQKLTNFQLLQAADAVAHGKNMHSVLVHSLNGTSFGRELLRRVPYLSSARVVKEVWDVQRQIAADTPAIREEIARLARHNMIRPEYRGQGSKYHPIRYTSSVIHQADTAARILLNRWFDRSVKAGIAKNTLENRYRFVSQMGEYNRQLMPRLEAMLRDSGASPFIVAGRNFNRFSRRLITGRPGFETTSAKAAVMARAAMLSGAAWGGLTPVVVNMLINGTPTGRKGTPLGAIDLGENYDTPEGKRRTIDVMQLMGIRRGLRGTGLNAVIEGVRNGETADEIAGHAAVDVGSTAMHPFTGPGIGFLERAVSGERFDLRAGHGEPFGPRRVEGGGRFLEQLRVALKEINPPAYGVIQYPLQSVMEKYGIPPSQSDEPTALSQVGKGLQRSFTQPLGYKETVSPALRTARERAIHLPFSPEQDIRFGTRRDILNMMKEDPEAARAMQDEAVQAGVLTRADVKALERSMKQPDPLFSAIKTLSPKDALDVFRMADDQEKELIYATVKAKIERSGILNPARKEEYMDKLRELSGR